jgi:SAM-dependent methyltransferase
VAHAFSDVDAQSEPLAWVGVLDRVGGDPLYAPYKRRIVEVLAPEPGGRYLELGCGTGADAVALADRFGVEVTGVDRSQTMVAEARRRGVETAVVADAHELPFASGSFDGAWADRTFQHLADPSAALAELARIVRRGGTVVVADPDYSTQSVAGPDPGLAARVLAFRCDSIGNGRLGSGMASLFGQAGLGEVHSQRHEIVVRRPDALDHALGLRDWAALAAKRGLVSPAEARTWEQSLDLAASCHRFRYSFAIVITSGTHRPVASGGT